MLSQVLDALFRRLTLANIGKNGDIVANSILLIFAYANGQLGRKPLATLALFSDLSLPITGFVNTSPQILVLFIMVRVEFCNRRILVHHFSHRITCQLGKGSIRGERTILAVSNKNGLTTIGKHLCPESPLFLSLFTLANIGMRPYGS